MTDQPSLFESPVEVKLTGYQETVLQLLTELGELNAATAGRCYHEAREGHVCGSYCNLERDGRGVLEALCKKGLVVRRRPGTGQTLYVLAGASNEGTKPYLDGPGDVIPF